MPKKGGLDIKTLLLFLGLLISTLLIHYKIQRSSDWLIPLYFLSFGFYFACYKKASLSFNQLLAFAILIRLLLFFSPPALSDDYYRFVWDGQLWAQGTNPYVSSPDHLIEDLPASYDHLYDQLNSQEYHTTYPPLSQYIFSIPAWLGVREVPTAVMMIRGVLFLFEIGTLLLLLQLTSPARVSIYALNPLVILELTGNLHFEGLVIFFTLLGYWLYQKGHWPKAAIALSLGVLAKLTPLMFLPVLIKKLGIKRASQSYMLMVSVLVLLSLPILNYEIIKGLFTGLDLFFRKFEFNAGLFFLTREVGFWVIGYDVVQTAGPRLSYVAFGLIMIYSFVVIHKKTDWLVAFSTILFIQLLFATTVHPWYVITLVAFSGLTGFLFPVIWSLLAFLSYAGYSPEGYTHPMTLITLEYMIVILLGTYEIVKQKPLLNDV